MFNWLTKDCFTRFLSSRILIWNCWLFSKSRLGVFSKGLKYDGLRSEEPIKSGAITFLLMRSKNILVLELHLNFSVVSHQFFVGILTNFGNERHIGTGFSRAEIVLFAAFINRCLLDWSLDCLELCNFARRLQLGQYFKFGSFALCIRIFNQTDILQKSVVQQCTLIRLPALASVFWSFAIVFLLNLLLVFRVKLNHCVWNFGYPWKFVLVYFVENLVNLSVENCCLTVVRNQSFVMGFLNQLFIGWAGSDCLLHSVHPWPPRRLARVKVVIPREVTALLRYQSLLWVHSRCWNRINSAL